jgi:exodeoxyribonuclease VII large subunit
VNTDSELSPGNPLGIFEITKAIDQRLTGQPGLANIFIKGEITDFKVQQASGHAYFTLTDKETDHNSSKKAVLNCTFFRFTVQKQTFTPRAGMEVLVFGSVSVYYPRGQYNFNAREIIEVGLGKLLIKIQELKQRFINEGVINPANRKKIPLLPRRIGIVTGLGTAALKDIMKQVLDRYPHVEIVISPALVQGIDAPASIVTALKEISLPKWECDVIIIGRGGGSPEDLMAFNDESVCRAIHTCPIPIISAVGHQIDHPVSDDVADLAAATPTDGAKIALPVIHEKEESLLMISKHLNNLITNRLAWYRDKIDRIKDKPFFKNPDSMILDYYRFLDEKEAQLNNAMIRIIDRSRNNIASVPDIEGAIERKLLKLRHDFSQFQERLTAFSPLATLKRGYAMVFKDGTLLKSIQNVQTGNNIEIRLYDGQVFATVSGKESTT